MSLNHFGMVLEGPLLLPLLYSCVRDVLIVAAWYGLNDILDYGIGPHPRVPNPWDYTAITTFTIGSTVVLSLVWLILWRSYGAGGHGPSPRCPASDLTPGRLARRHHPGQPPPGEHPPPDQGAQQPRRRGGSVSKCPRS